jgi:hypothetical protein
MLGIPVQKVPPNRIQDSGDEDIVANKDRDDAGLDDFSEMPANDA